MFKKGILLKSTNNQNGFSLVELMIVSGIMSVMILGMNSLMLNATKINLKMQMDNDHYSTLNEIGSVLSSPQDCLSTLGGKRALDDSTITSIVRGGLSKFVVNIPFGIANTKIVNYQLKSNPEDLGRNEAALTINFEKKKLLGGGLTPKQLRLYVEVDSSNSVTACRAITTNTDNLWKHGDTQSNINYAAGNVGIGTKAPTEKLEVSGGLKIGFTDSPCNPSKEGVLRMNVSSHVLEYCDGTNWEGIKSHKNQNQHEHNTVTGDIYGGRQGAGHN